MNDVREWLIARDDKVIGPLTAGQVQQFLSRSQLRATDRIRRLSDKQWIEVRRLVGFRSQSEPPPRGLPAPVAENQGLKKRPIQPVVPPPIEESQWATGSLAAPLNAEFVIDSSHFNRRRRKNGIRALAKYWTATGIASLLLMCLGFFWIARPSVNDRADGLPERGLQELADPSQQDSNRNIQTASVGASPQKTAENVPGILGVGFDQLDGELIVSTLVVDWPALQAGLRLGDKIVGFSFTNGPMTPTAGMSVENARVAMAGKVGEPLWLAYVRSQDPTVRLVMLLRKGNYSADAAKALLWREHISSPIEFGLELPLEILEHFEGSQVTYTLLRNQSALLAANGTLLGQRIAILIDQLSPKITPDKLELCLTDDPLGPTVSVNRRDAPGFFDAIVSNDPRGSRYTVLHLAIGENARSSLRVDLEEIMFLEQEPPYAHKPVIRNKTDSLVSAPRVQGHSSDVRSSAFQVAIQRKVQRRVKGISVGFIKIPTVANAADALKEWGERPRFRGIDDGIDKAVVTWQWFRHIVMLGALGDSAGIFELEQVDGAASPLAQSRGDIEELVRKDLDRRDYDAVAGRGAFFFALSQLFSRDFSDEGQEFQQMNITLEHKSAAAAKYKEIKDQFARDAAETFEKLVAAGVFKDVPIPVNDAAAGQGR